MTTDHKADVAGQQAADHKDKKTTSAEATPPPIVSTGNTKHQPKGMPAPGAPAATSHNSMAGSASSGTITFRPNNYRRQIIAHELQAGAIARIKDCYTSVSSGGHNKLIFIRDYPGVLLQVGKTRVTAIWSQPVEKGEKQALVKHYETPMEAEAWLDAEKEKRRALLDAVLEDFAKRLEIMGMGTPTWERGEDGYRGDTVIDSLPPEMVVDDELFKKVYKDWFEFKAGGSTQREPTQSLRTFIHNRALEKVAPDIVTALNMLQIRLSPLDAAKQLITEWPNDLFTPQVKAIVVRMTPYEKSLLMEWAFEEFGRAA